MAMDLLSFSKWFYRGEGNKTLVLSNPETRQVLRLQKSRVTSTDRTNSTHEESNMRREFEQSIKLCKQIFIPLLSEKYVEPGLVVELPQEFMTNIKDLVTSANKERPHFRLSKEVNSQNKFGVLMPDFCFVSGDGNYANEVERTPTFCVEIKPKCGSMPVCQELENSTYRKVKESICKYCLLQWMKVNVEGKYPQRSEYCPLDLFSSDIKRIWHALMCLLKNPQNNLRIFQDGEMVYSGETMAPLEDGDCQLDNGNTTDRSPSDVKSKFLPHLLQLEDILRHSFSGDHADQTTSQNLYGEIDGANLTSTTMFLATLLQLLIHDSNESFIDSNHHHPSEHLVCGASVYDGNHSARVPTCLMSKGLVFGQGGVLSNILGVQKLDQIGTDKAYGIFNKLCANGHKDVIDTHIFTMSENVTKCSNSIDDSTNANCCENILDACIANENSSIASELDNLTNFFIAASVNDCSIMISFQKVIDGTPTDSSYFQNVLIGTVYKYSIAIVDLDQKESDRIPKYHQDYHDIIDNYLHFNEVDYD